MAKNRAKKIGFTKKGRVKLEAGRILSKNGMSEVFAENRRFPAKMGGLESVIHCTQSIYSASWTFQVWPREDNGGGWETPSLGLGICNM